MVHSYEHGAQVVFNALTLKVRKRLAVMRHPKRLEAQWLIECSEHCCRVKL